MENVTNFIRIWSNDKLKISPEKDFFRAWTEFLKPVHKLTNREMDVFAVFLKKRWELSKAIIDENVLDAVLMSEATKRQIRIECNITPKHFQVIMGKFRKNNIINNGKIRLNLIPQMTEEGVGLMVYFSFKDEQHVRLSS